MFIRVKAKKKNISCLIPNYTHTRNIKNLNISNSYTLEESPCYLVMKTLPIGVSKKEQVQSKCFFYFLQVLLEKNDSEWTEQ